jgi:nucleotide-binding universal stress UspA family protein
MINILVPTDFSPLSKAAIKYAVRIANQLNGVVTLLHVITISQPVRVSMHDKMRDLEDDMIRRAEKDLEKLAYSAMDDLTTDRPIQYSVVRGSTFSNELQKESQRLKTHLIVMGTKGASGIKKTVVGSNTTSVIGRSALPILAVPEKAKYRGFKDIVYACDLRNPIIELKRLSGYASRFDSTIHIVHVAPPGADVESIDQKLDGAIKSSKVKNAVSVVLVDHDIEGAIEQYIGVNKADLLAMFTHKVTFYEKLFDRSMTRKIAFHSPVPLLAFRKDKD